MIDEEFEQLISAFDSFWNETIVTSYIQIKSYLMQGYTPQAYNGLSNCFTQYANLINQFVAEMKAVFSRHHLNKQQQTRLVNYMNECHETRTADILELKKIESSHRKGHFLPLPTLEEQLSSGQIFPDNPCYLNVHFDDSDNPTPSFSA
ncbi:hypothetical protein [Legionella erythra]|uniref:Uncharacterized protein n=1 Tax=Legionella erythra TaxID=448 RepID=A0A0W0TS01_LEGER|nr:hypothetical protein [Legionella erythra]KTC98288.1 hypothetical protein Lery_1342 [Legionella erythra]